MKSFFVTGWNNGSYNKTGAGYGLKISVLDRNSLFDKKKNIATLILPNKKKININTNKPSFWNSQCRELISKDIGNWMIQNHVAPWKKGHPPKLKLTKLDSNLFKLSKT